MEKKKLCYSCKLEKPTFEFSFNKTKKDGFSDECKECSREYGILRRSKLKEKNKLVKAEYRTCPKCGENKHRSDFHSALTNSDGLSTYCKPCRTELRTKVHEPKKCQVCGKIFLPKREDAVYCSKRCGTEAWWNSLSEDEKVNKLKEYYTTDYNRNKFKILQRGKKWSSENRELINNNIKKKYWKNHNKAREENREKQNTYSKELRDCYVRNKITSRTNLKSKDIPQALIDVYKEKIRVERLINEMSN